ncbi:MAG: transposase family protein [Propionibacteriaceae bacterium]|uniref:Uncharacterized protein n=1 Tax=Propionibacterium ruminifibrarum TaxID=1962131 RepID=A0A375HZ66_9ACTN|nr:transposase family protein [Propionibacterium ruminifibrarum]MBE6476575.1 transposase family protein [Propionibacteriaceae bacterium]SPF67038.1 Hypothetical protein PROPJV5_0046 [Propionibacterium ruminifibrarum]
MSLFTHVPGRHPMSVMLALLSQPWPGAKSVHAIGRLRCRHQTRLLARLDHPTNVVSGATLLRVIEWLEAETLFLIRKHGHGYARRPPAAS